MKKIIITIFFLLLILSAFPVSAQNVTRDQFFKIYAEYRTKYDEYVVLHDKYILSKKQYEQFKTLSSKENLQKDLQKMLVKRDEVLIYYYKSIISKMDDSSISIPDDRKNEYVGKFNDEIAWTSEHLLSYKENDSPVALSVKSEEVDTRFQDFQKDLYKSLFYISRGKIEAYNARYDFLYNDLYSLTERIKNEQREAYKLSDSKIDTIYRWFGEINLKTEGFAALLDKADIQISKAEKKGSRGVYDASVKILNSAMTLFIERLSNTNEIIREIKVSESVN